VCCQGRAAGNLTVKLQAQAPDWVALMLGKIDALSLLSAGKAAIAGMPSWP
jgi:hypothetical protein